MSDEILLEYLEDMKKERKNSTRDIVQITRDRIIPVEANMEN